MAILDAGGKTGDELRAMVDQAIAQKGWLVLLFHGVGNETTCPKLDYQPTVCMINYLVTSRPRTNRSSSTSIRRRPRSGPRPSKKSHNACSHNVSETDRDLWTNPEFSTGRDFFAPGELGGIDQLALTLLNGTVNIMMASTEPRRDTFFVLRGER